MVAQPISCFSLRAVPSRVGESGCCGLKQLSLEPMRPTVERVANNPLRGGEGVSRMAHNHQIAGANPAPATTSHNPHPYL